MLGPFPSADLGTDFLAEVGGEAGVAPSEGDQVVTAEGNTLVWRRYSTRQNFIDLGEALGDHENATAYAYCVLQSEIAGEAGLDLRSLNIDDSVEMWLNGEWLGLEVQEGANGCLLKIGHDSGRWGFALRLYPPDRAVLAGAVTDAAGEPVPYVDMRLERDGAVIAEWQTDYWGEYDEVNVYPADGAYDLSATQGTRGAWHIDLELQPGDRRELGSVLEEAVHIAGTLVMADDFTPHVAVPVQALRMGPGGPQVVATTLSDKGGRYQFVNLKPGPYQVRCQILGGHVYYTEPLREAPGPHVSSANDGGSILDIGPGTALAGIDFRIAPFKKGVWRSYNTLNGLKDSHVYAIDGDADGVLWVGARQSVYRFDGTDFVAIDGPDEMAFWVNVIDFAADGTLWVGCESGLYRYEGADLFSLPTLPNHAVLDLDTEADGALWIATDRGVFRRGVDGSIEPLAKLAGIRTPAIYSDPEGATWFGTDRGVYRYDGRDWDHFATADGLAADYVGAIDRAPDGAMWFGTAGGASRYDPHTGAFDNLTAADGLAHNFVSDLDVSADGVVWLATDAGVSRYDGRTCVNFTTADGLSADIVFSIYRDREGHLWFATEAGGVSHYDEQTFFNITTRDGFVDAHITAYEVEPDGTMWFGTGFTPTSGQGVFRYDGVEFVQFTTADGLAGNSIRASARCPDGSLWFGSIGGGASRYDGTRFETLTSADGLASDYVETIYCDPEGIVWFGLGYPPYDHGGRISRYDGESFVNLTHEDGVPPGVVFAIHRDPDGVMWFGSGRSFRTDVARGSGVTRYDGESLVNLPAADGWPHAAITIYGDADGAMLFFVNSGIARYDGHAFTEFPIGMEAVNGHDIYRAADGMLWVGTNSGAFGYDGASWTRLDTRDGLANNQIMGIFQRPEGSIWFCTARGITRYRRSEIAPAVQIDYVQTDEWQQAELDAIPAVETNTRITIGYRAIDFKTIPEKRQYRYRIKELDDDWRQPTRASAFEWKPERSGTYTFEVQAIDRDLLYSEPAQVTIQVTPQYGQIVLWSSLVVLSIGLVLAGRYGLSRRRERDQIREQLVEELEREMQTAHELQMSLMPAEAPSVPGIEVAGQCIPATEVGGDIFQYFSQEDRFALAVADVTGHGMQAAVPVMTFSGILNTEMQYGHRIEALFARLNDTLHASLDRRTFICFSMGEVDPVSRRFRVSNCGSPYPCHYRAATREVVELQMDAYPLGIRSGSVYEAMEVQLEPGDRVVFFSDGLVEAANAEGEFFGFERIAETIRQGCVDNLTAQNLMQRIFGEVKVFSGDVPQEDDQTLVVLQIGD